MGGGFGVGVELWVVRGGIDVGCVAELVGVSGGGWQVGEGFFGNFMVDFEGSLGEVKGDEFGERGDGLGGRIGGERFLQVGRSLRRGVGIRNYIKLFF